MTQSILAFYSENVWSKDHKRKTHKTLHWILQALGSSAAIAGMMFEFVNLSQREIQHFVGPHAILGLIAFILTVIGMLNGVSALWSVEIRTYVKPVYLKFAHNLNGIAAFVIGKLTDDCLR